VQIRDNCSLIKDYKNYMAKMLIINDCLECPNAKECFKKLSAKERFIIKTGVGLQNSILKTCPLLDAPEPKEMKFDEDEIRWLLFYGTPSRNSDIKIDDDGKIDIPIHMMFDFLEKETYINRKEVERVFWSRIKSLMDLKNKS
jgi:hypothetical protein